MHSSSCLPTVALRQASSIRLPNTLSAIRI